MIELSYPLWRTTPSPLKFNLKHIPNINYIKETLGLESESDKKFIEQLEKYTELPEKDQKNLFKELSDRFDQKAEEYNKIQQLAKGEDGQTDQIIKEIEAIIRNEANQIKKKALQQLLEQTRKANEYNEKVEEDIKAIEKDEDWKPTQANVDKFESKIDKHLTEVSEQLAGCGLELPLEPSTKKRSGGTLTKVKFIAEMREDLSENFKTIKTKIHNFFSQKIGTFYNKIFKTGDNQAAKKTFMSAAFEAPKPAHNLSAAYTF